jgi:TolB-like protein/Tfp pilus assembly protein PilF
VTIAVVVVALGYLVADRLVLSKRSAEVGALPGSVAQNAPATAFNPPPHSIAVLPFVNMSGDAAQDYFSDGISEELLDSLSRLNGLQVAARTSSFSFNGQNADVSTIAHKLNVGAILEGSVRRAGNTVRITVQLINAVSGFHIWSQTYDRNLVDILKLQTDVATSVAQQLKIALVGDEAEKIELGGTRIPEAYDAYLRGVQQMASGDTQQSQMNHLAALAAFDQAIALDSKYALAYAGRADSLLKVSYYEPNVNKRPGFRQEARSAAERAVALAPELGEAHLALGRVRSYEFLDIPGGGPEFDRALALAPGNARVQSGFAEFASLLGHVESALKAARWAVSLDPQNPSSYMRLAYVLNDARRYDEELEVLHHAQVLYPDSKEVGGAMAGYLLASGQAEVARQYCESPSTPMIQWGRHYCLSLAYHALGQSTDAERHLKELMALSKDGDVIPYAGIYAQWGNKPEALRWLMTAERLRDPNLILIKVDSELDPIRNEPQFKAIEARLKFPP